MTHPLSITELERELLELCAMAGETTTALDEEMLINSPGRAAVETALRGLLEHGLLETSRGTYSDSERSYEDDWWEVTREGRRAAGLSPR